MHASVGELEAYEMDNYRFFIKFFSFIFSVTYMQLTRATESEKGLI